MTEKISGYSLIIVGIAIILFTGINVYQVFSKKIPPVSFFNFPPISLDASQIIGIELPKEERDLLKTQMGQANKLEVLPSSVLNDSSNIVVHILLMGFISGLGLKISTIGTQLVRPINVKLKETKTA